MNLKQAAITVPSQPKHFTTNNQSTGMISKYVFSCEQLPADLADENWTTSSDYSMCQRC